ncbi:MlaD family protein [Pseudobdellovibrio exovorus]|uniref:Mce/MlaD domain-containing protein n=1 Tax=Pseudobdellovibrio exovorus JSS TaxID=1184267 RepID=M4V5W8_9BACT|nr:MlaD family protein [Pseudobdellovibrio exovorus]AGH94568.1 hypothetical protein A11Q_348 [Pseudobdellovibrio exovorus JSS]
MSKFKNFTHRLSNSWYIWLFPVFAICICAWLAYDHYDKRGPQIRILFDDAASLQVGRTQVRFRGVTIGVVSDIAISDDYRKAIATVDLQKESAHFAVEGSRFWVVSPQVNFQGISGLETLIEGTYIAVHPGDSKEKSKFDFIAQETAVTNDALENTSSYILQTADAQSVNAGDSITFRGLVVGSVTRVSLSQDSRVVNIQINIQNRYTKLIRTNTNFWRKSGIQANLGLFNSEVKIGSLDTLMRGGVELFTPDEAGPLAKAGTRFELLNDAPKGYEKWNPQLTYK